MNRKLLASAICASLLIAGTAYAQDTSTPAQQSQDQSTTNQSSTSNPSGDEQEQQQNVQTLKSITVTGSLLKRPEYQTTSPIQVVNMQADVATGAFGTADILMQTSAAAGSTQINNQFSGFIIEGGTGIQAINLRGLGANRTLVLLDGQRPGPAGTRGQTGAGFDLNVVPRVIIDRIEIVKDGSSSIYGSDAISGVVNLITRKRMDGTEFEASYAMPQHGGGQQATASVASGFNFDNGNILIAAQFQKQYPLALGQRDFLKCPQDRFWGKGGVRIDREDHSYLQGTSLAGCDNMLQNEIIDAVYGIRYVPSKDGHTVGQFPGFHMNTYTRYDDPNHPTSIYSEEVTNSPFQDKAWAINKNQNTSFYANANFNFGSVFWDTQFLYDHRETETHGWRQFAPQVYAPTPAGGPSDACPAFGLPYGCGWALGFPAGTGIGVFLPVIPYPDNHRITVDYYYLRSQLSGGFGDSSWTWQVNGTHSRSDGDYSGVGIDVRNSGDSSNPDNTLPQGMTPFNVFDPCILSGKCMDQVVSAVGLYQSGNTRYDQSTLNAVFSGDLFKLPAGTVSSAFGIEYRHYKIDDVPSAATMNGWAWGYSSAQRTQGADHVTELFGEVGIPLLEGLPGVQSLTADISARSFKYASVGDRDHVWKYGLNWQITPTWRVRGTIGTSYRAPALYEMYLGDQTGFLSQSSIDPCVNWGQSNNELIRARCAGLGIPGNYSGARNGSATSYLSGAGPGGLIPETSRAKSLGVVWTPTFGNFNVALDYFDYHIRGEIARLGSANIVYSCYARPVYPNAFCDLFHRNPSTATTNANMITEIHESYVNINSERTRGYDLQVNYSDDFSFGKLSADLQITYTIEDSVQLFDASQSSGFDNTDFVGSIGRPATVGLAHVSLEHGDWTYTWQGKYVGSTEDLNSTRVTTYAGYPDAVRDIKAGWQLLHSVSVGYDTGKWGARFGIRNLFDKQPDLISSGLTGTASARVGNTPLYASQYDWFGRTFFVSGNYRF